jgi:hypothetical protein
MQGPAADIPTHGNGSYTPLKQWGQYIFKVAAYEPMKDSIDAFIQSRLTPSSTSGVTLWNEADLEAFKNGNKLLQTVYDKVEDLEKYNPLTSMPKDTNRMLPSLHSTAHHHNSLGW